MPNQLPALDFSVPVLGLLLLAAAALFFLARGVRRVIRERSFKAAQVLFLIGGLLVVVTVTLTLLGGRGALLGSRLFLVFCLVVFTIFLLWHFFRKAIGSILFLAIGGFVLVVVLFIRSLVAFTGETRIATVRVLQVDKETISLQIEKAGPAASGPEVPTMLRLKGARFGPVVYQVVFSDTAIFVGAKTRYAWLGMTALDTMAKQTDLHLFPDFFRRMEVFSAMEKRELSLPFVRTVQLSMDTKLAIPGKIYDILVKNNGGILIVPRAGQ